MPYKNVDDQKASCKAYHDAHKKELNARSKAYYETHKEEVLARRKAYYETHKDKAIAWGKTYYETHKEERTIYHRTYIEAHKEEARTRDKVYYKEHKEERNARCKAYREEHTTDIICQQCGNHAKKYVGSNSGLFCSLNCSRKWHVGHNNPRWLGGISFGSYCPKFNDVLKESVRSQFNRRCFLSGIKENGQKLSVHHCDYLKSQGCKGQRWSLLPLQKGWHSKTNVNRWYWFALLRDYWVYKYLTFHGMDIFEGPDRTEWLWEMYNNGSN